MPRASTFLVHSTVLAAFALCCAEERSPTREKGASGGVAGETEAAAPTEAPPEPEATNGGAPAEPTEPAAGEGGGAGSPNSAGGEGGTAGEGGAGGAAGAAQSGADCSGELAFTQHAIDQDFTGENKALADLDGDGLLDVVVGNTALKWYQAPLWSAHQIALAEGTFIGHMQAGDINGDGAPDIVTPDGDFIVWFENPGGSLAADAAAWTRHEVGDQQGWAHELELADMDRDDKLDIVTNQPLKIWLQGALPTQWQQVRLHGLADAEGLALGRVDADDRVDLAVRGHWIQSPADAREPDDYERFEVDDAMHDSVVIKVADIDEDGVSDLVYAPKEDNVSEIVWYSASDPTQSWTKHVVAPAGFVHEFVVADFDGSGRPDIAFAEMSPGPTRRVGIFLQTPQADWSLKLIADSGSHNIVVGDLGNDCDLDIVGANWEAPPVNVFENHRCDDSGVHCPLR